MSGFMDVIVRTEPEISVSCRSGMMVLEEGLRDGRWVTLSYSASGHLMAANPRPKPSYMDISRFSRPEAFRLNIDGQDLCSRWIWQGAEVTRGEEKISVAVTLKHALRPVTVRVCTELDGTEILRRSLIIENTGAVPAALSSVSPLSGGLQVIPSSIIDVSGGLYRLGYMKSSVWGTEGDFHWRDLDDEITTIAGRYRRDRHRHPMFLLENRRTGETFVCQFAWTGGYAMTFDLNREHPGTAALSLDIAVDAPAPLRILSPGETFVTPAVHIGAVFGGLDPAIQTMHGHIRRSVFLPPTDGVSGWVEAGIGPEYDMDVASTKKSIEHAAAMGAEIYFIDAGWYLPPNREEDWWNKCGDWRYDAERYPNGIAELRDYARANGMRFGMWMDAERIGPMSRVWQEHGDWRAMNYTGRRTETGLLNLAIPEVAAWMEKEIRYLLDEYQLDMFRLDHNVGAWDAVAYNERGGYLENTWLRYYENLYDIYRRLRRDYPHVVFENCAGGGGRTDIGMTANFTHSWVTDWQIHPRAFSITNGMTMALPPECVDRLIGGQTAYLTADMRTLIRNLIFARPTVGCFKPPYADFNPMQVEIVRHHIDLYKSFVRPMHANGRIFHHTPDLSANLDGFGILEMAMNDATRGMIGVFRLAEPEQGCVTVYPRGVDPAKSYRVTFDNSGSTTVISGMELLRGLPVRLGGALTSELILYEAQ